MTRGGSMMLRMYSMLIICLLFNSSLLAESYIREYTYNASEVDSKHSSRIIALDLLKGTVNLT